MSKNLADELAPHGIAVVTVHPGQTRTEGTPADTRVATPPNLLGRMVEATEVAHVVTFLASPKAVAINGDVIAVGGGTTGTINY